MACILLGVNATGDVLYYTGRAGDLWVSSKGNEAFKYELLEGARRTAKRLNESTTVHGLRFIAMPAGV